MDETIIPQNMLKIQGFNEKVCGVNEKKNIHKDDSIVELSCQTTIRKDHLYGREQLYHRICKKFKCRFWRFIGNTLTISRVHQFWNGNRKKSASMKKFVGFRITTSCFPNGEASGFSNGTCKMHDSYTEQRKTFSLSAYLGNTE